MNLKEAKAKAKEIDNKIAEIRKESALLDDSLEKFKDVETRRAKGEERALLARQVELQTRVELTNDKEAKKELEDISNELAVFDHEYSTIKYQVVRGRLNFNEHEVTKLKRLRDEVKLSIIEDSGINYEEFLQALAKETLPFFINRKFSSGEVSGLIQRNLFAGKSDPVIVLTPIWQKLNREIEEKLA